MNQNNTIKKISGKLSDRKYFLPTTKQDLIDRNIDQLDFICVNGDAYVDHPSFGMPIIARILESEGFTVGIISQPNWRNSKDITSLGKPKYAFLVSSGNVDSMVNHYTSAKKLRTDDYYSPGGKAGKRPDRALTVYCNLIRKEFGEVPIIIGGLEASLRRFAHYDYWNDEVMPSVLVDTDADILVYGMGEKAISEIAYLLEEGKNISDCKNIRGTCYMVDSSEIEYGILNCPSYELVKSDKVQYAKSCKLQYDEHDHFSGRKLLQKHGKKAVVQNEPMPPLSTEEFDKVFELPFVRYYHPDYEALGGIPAIEEVEFSIVHNRGCFGNCNFCAIAYHQGRYISKRSKESIISEAESFTKSKRFKGYVHDVGGPTANFRNPSCLKQEKHGMCKGKKCLAPEPCQALDVSHVEYLDILRNIRDIKGIKKVFIRSGLRYDYMIKDSDETFFDELVQHHISGQLKVAPEHCSLAVLNKMGKPNIEVYKRFQDKFYNKTKRAGKEQYLVPYLMSSHPGSTIKDAIELTLFLKQNNIRPEQVQDFYPTPGTISTCMFYTELDPYTMEKVYVAKSPKEKKIQRALLQYYKPNNEDLVRQALLSAGRKDLIGNSKNCLVAPAKVNNFRFNYNSSNDISSKKYGGHNNGGRKRKNKRK